MKNNILKKVYKEKNCEHDWENMPCGITNAERIGGRCINVYRCKKCRFISTKKNNNI